MGIVNKNKTTNQATEQTMVAMIMDALKSIYANRSSDEYKSHGDITLTSEYKSAEKMVGDLATIHGYPKTAVGDLKTLFLTLHRPIWKNMVSEYINEPNERNSVFTAVYTVGYRVLIGELSRVYSSTVATAKGISYKPDKVSKQNDMTSFIRSFNASLEERINGYLKSSEATKPIQESAQELIDAGVKVFDAVNKGIKKATEVITKLVHKREMVGSILDLMYNQKVTAYRKIAATYLETKVAYEEYVRIPEAQQNQKITSKYIKMLKKYEIRMENAKAAIEHYDSRAHEEMRDKLQDAIKEPAKSPEQKSDDAPSNKSDDDMDF